MQPATKRCQTIFFCSKACKTECWPRHRTKCKLIQQADGATDLTVPKRFKYLYHDFGLRCYCSEEVMALQEPSRALAKGEADSDLLRTPTPRSKRLEKWT